jgi:hypothetical protein
MCRQCVDGDTSKRFLDDGQPGSCRFVRRISTDKRACRHLSPSCRQAENYPGRAYTNGLYWRYIAITLIVAAAALSGVNECKRLFTAVMA